ncbi:MAG: hypothetical protein A2X25_07945 [Chloroflexi bacterium GWB2_49_20]|nr:MAG: hypothetical protein A2X25_07945 [Chloroflexi bacterium GWB2_49_20]OGN79630.1 MAG: hypothetical protein A2X26_06080 [Chloroflexi bacterium GWC2_49_37]OGN84447.1 MAG: hypothetical protein A2X27_10450 [Chloroflexi bacterium GWD2_49_16]HBG74133.1 hypothetical protein [Anaerolineae bacterium]HCC78935.1 hypothetical protein [Anaerolineae bacterium]
MEEEKETKNRFMGTYFDPTIIFRLSGVARVLGWVVLAVYSIDFIVALMVMVLQILRGYWFGLGFTDYVTNILITLERPFRGLVYFVVLLGISEVLKIFVDIEENTRRAARK